MQSWSACSLFAPVGIKVCALHIGICRRKWESTDLLSVSLAIRQDWVSANASFFSGATRQVLNAFIRRVGQKHTLYGACTVFLAGASPNIRSYTVFIYTVLADPIHTWCPLSPLLQPGHTYFLNHGPLFKTNPHSHAHTHNSCLSISPLLKKATAGRHPSLYPASCSNDNVCSS